MHGTMSTQISFSFDQIMAVFVRKKILTVVFAISAIFAQLSNCQTIECPRFKREIKRTFGIDIEKVRQQVIAPISIKNHLTSAWGFSTIIASGYATGGN